MSYIFSAAIPEIRIVLSQPRMASYSRIHARNDRRAASASPSHVDDGPQQRARRSPTRVARAPDGATARCRRAARPGGVDVLEPLRPAVLAPGHGDLVDLESGDPAIRG